MTRTIGTRRTGAACVQVVLGDITTLAVDAIVIAANARRDARELAEPA